MTDEQKKEAGIQTDAEVRAEVDKIMRGKVPMRERVREVCELVKYHLTQVEGWGIERYIIRTTSDYAWAWTDGEKHKKLNAILRDFGIMDSDKLQKHVMDYLKLFAKHNDLLDR